ncbi:hypothetical protein [Mycobacterium sp. URHB0044]|uniref:hypothetical protein n=1 Tax=Mycobacterium sp. URHB0044 TaxID=1380386 RepID=UPI00048EA313|nr:hypothetical protein [Mycobacterium sp. URHB0044]
MQVAVRPHVTAGVALVGASLIAASTISPMPDIHLPEVHLPAIHTANVHLAALVNPLEVYAQVFQDALANAGTLADNALPGQLLKQLIANQVSSAATLAAAVQTTGGDIATALTTQVPQLLQTAVTQLAAGNVSGAVNSLLQGPLAVVLPAVDLLPALQTILTKPLQNLVNVVNSFTSDPLATELLLSGFIAPLISTPAAAAVAFQNVLSAVGTLNPVAVASAILAAPAVVADGLLNGGYGPDLGALVSPGLTVKAGGLLSSPGLVFNDDGSFFVNTGGPLAALQQVLQKIATAIAPPAPATAQVAKTDIASVPSAGAATLTLSTPSIPAKATPSTETPSTETAGAAEPSAQNPEAPAPAADTTKAPTTESSGTTAGSATKTESTDAAGGKTPTDKGADETTGNKVEPHTTAGSATTKSGDTAAAGGETATEHAGTKTATSESSADKGADSATKKASTSK